MRNVLAPVPKGNTKMIAAAIRTVFAQPDSEHVQLDVLAGMRDPRSATGRRSGGPIR
jgi:putative transposase